MNPNGALSELSTFSTVSAFKAPSTPTTFAFNLGHRIWSTPAPRPDTLSSVATYLAVTAPTSRYSSPSTVCTSLAITACTSPLLSGLVPPPLRTNGNKIIDTIGGEPPSVAEGKLLFQANGIGSNTAGSLPGNSHCRRHNTRKRSTRPRTTGTESEKRKLDAKAQIKEARRKARRATLPDTKVRKRTTRTTVAGEAKKEKINSCYEFICTFCWQTFPVYSAASTMCEKNSGKTATKNGGLRCVGKDESESERGRREEVKPAVVGSYRIACSNCAEAVQDLSICWRCGEEVRRGMGVVSVGWCFWHWICWGCAACGAPMKLPLPEDRESGYTDEGALEVDTLPFCMHCDAELENGAQQSLQSNSLEGDPGRVRLLSRVTEITEPSKTPCPTQIEGCNPLRSGKRTSKGICDGHQDLEDSITLSYVSVLKPPKDNIKLPTCRSKPVPRWMNLLPGNRDRIETLNSSSSMLLPSQFSRLIRAASNASDPATQSDKGPFTLGSKITPSLPKACGSKHSGTIVVKKLKTRPPFTRFFEGSSFSIFSSAGLHNSPTSGMTTFEAKREPTVVSPMTRMVGIPTAFTGLPSAQTEYVQRYLKPTKSSLRCSTSVSANSVHSRAGATPSSTDPVLITVYDRTHSDHLGMDDICPVCNYDTVPRSVKDPSTTTLRAPNGKNYHDECFRCLICHDGIESDLRAGFKAWMFLAGKPMHRACVRDRFGSGVGEKEA